jgi:hypothetical protein
MMVADTAEAQSRSTARNAIPAKQQDRDGTGLDRGIIK